MVSVCVIDWPTSVMAGSGGVSTRRLLETDSACSDFARFRLSSTKLVGVAAAIDEDRRPFGSCGSTALPPAAVSLLDGLVATPAASTGLNRTYKSMTPVASQELSNGPRARGTVAVSCVPLYAVRHSQGTRFRTVLLPICSDSGVGTNVTTDTPAIDWGLPSSETTSRCTDSQLMHVSLVML